MNKRFWKKTSKISLVTIDKKLDVQYEVKYVLRSMAQGVRSLYTLRNWVSENFNVALLAFLISHLQYPALLLCSLPQNLITTLEKHNWAVKDCYNRRKIDLITILN